MATESKFQEELLNILRNKLNIEKVQLWIPPYSTETGEKGERPMELATRYSTELGLDLVVVEETLEQLRAHSVEKLNAKKKFLELGVATLKIKLSGIPSYKGDKMFNVVISLASYGHALRENIATKCEMEFTQLLRLISSGHIIDDHKTLQEQNIKNNGVVMAIGITNPESAAKEASGYSKVAKAKEAAGILTKNMDDENSDDKYTVEIADQTGKPLKLPPEESKALAMAMTLHEKGKAGLKRQEFNEALLFLLEADQEFKKCRADILNAVDNYAVLCLDIVWCYLCMQNVRDLPDAEMRLRKCEACFIKSYGTNLERLRALKGEVGTEMALFMRLHLLQGILAFHQNRIQDAKGLLRKAESELSSLRVDDDKLMQVMTMGFSQQEARLGLRACDSDIERAVEFIVKKQQERKDRIQKEKEEKRKRKKGQDLGKTNKGKWLSGEAHEKMISMGIPSGGAREALRRAENDVTVAIQFLQDQPELYSLADPQPITNDLIEQVVSLGFSHHQAKLALQEEGGDLQNTIDKLLKQQQQLQYGDASTADNSYSSSSASTSSSNETESVDSDDSSKKQQKNEEARETLMADIPESEEDYLDLTLDQEAQFLAEYQSLLSTLKM